jgi:hypothetical protein
VSRPRLSSWLNDHLAAANAGVELARRTRDENRGTDFEQPLADLAAELEADRDALRAVLRELGLREDRVKQAGVWTAEKVGRLKLNGQWRGGYNPASRMVELDGLAAVVTFNRAAWQGLAALRAADGGPAERDLDELAARAASRLERLDELRARAAPLAFAGE